MNRDITHTIKEVTEMLGVTHRTLHYYEDKFNLQINRDSSGNRTYKDKDIDLFEVILDLKGKGMNLDGIKKQLIERGILNENESKDIILIDEGATDLKETLLQEIASTVAHQLRNELQQTNEIMNKILEDNNDLREEINLFKKQSEEHYSKIDQQITEWRGRKQPWYKRIMK